MTASSSSPIRVACIGAGPAALMTLERLVARHARDTPWLPLEVHLIDPYEPGGGRIWRREQSPLLKLNSMLRDVSVFTDETCEITGPIAPGPALDEWVRLVREGELPSPNWSDGLLDEEIARASEQDFPTRRLNNAYLGWAFERVVEGAEPTVAVSWHRTLVLELDGANAERSTHLLRLSDGTELEADIVVHLLGHSGSEVSGESIELGAFADRHALDYVAPAFTADVEFGWLQPGEPVIVRGMGLAAVDLVVLLTEGRGGRFEVIAEGGGRSRLKYHPSGAEPLLHLGSRRGVPYRSKITSELVGAPIELEYLGASFRDYLAARDEPLDFARDVWPLVASELLIGYYRELFTGHPEQVRGDWAEFAPRLRAILSRPEGYRSEALLSLIEREVPDPLDRFDLDSFDRPLASPSRDAAASSPSVPGLVPNSDAVQDAVTEHISRDLTLRTSPRHSATQGLFLTALFAYFAIAEVPRERWNARSLTVLVPKRWHSYFSYLASGPPGHRLEEFLALADAGVLRFLGGELRLETDEQSGVFRAEGRAYTPDGLASSSVAARVLIDAWLPEAEAEHSDNPLLRHLIASGQATEVASADEQHTGSTGQLLVAGEGRLPGTRRQFALGPFTSILTGGAFTRPGMNSLAFRRHDALAGGILEEAQRWSVRSNDDLPVVAEADVRD